VLRRNQRRQAVRSLANRFGSAGTVEVAHFALSESCARALRVYANGWFEWKLPDLPEDLAIQVGDRVLIGGVTHERTCWFEGERAFLDSMLHAAPTLKVLQGPGFRGGR